MRFHLGWILFSSFLFFCLGLDIIQQAEVAGLLLNATPSIRLVGVVFRDDGKWAEG